MDRSRFGVHRDTGRGSPRCCRSVANRAPGSTETPRRDRSATNCEMQRLIRHRAVGYERSRHFTLRRRRRRGRGHRRVRPVRVARGNREPNTTSTAASVAAPRGRSPPQAEHRRELAEVVAGLRDREELLGAVGARAARARSRPPRRRTRGRRLIPLVEEHFARRRAARVSGGSPSPAARGVSSTTRSASGTMRSSCVATTTMRPGCASSRSSRSTPSTWM